MNNQELKTKKANQPDALIIGSAGAEMEEHLAYLNMEETKASECKLFLVALVLLVGIVAFGCDEQGKEIISTGPQTIYLLHQENSPELIKFQLSSSYKCAVTSGIEFLFDWK